jgi:hypothetical protein
MSIDINQLPADVRALIEAEVNKVLKANEPAPPKEATPSEQARAHLLAAYRAENGDRSTPSGSSAVHVAIMEVLALLVDAVFPEEKQETNDKNGKAEVKTVAASTTHTPSEPPNVTASLGR